MSKPALDLTALDQQGAELSTLPVKLTPEQCGALASRPLRMLPMEWRGEVWKFWAFWSHVLQDQLALSVRLREWIDEGLTLEGARHVFEDLTAAGEAMNHKFPGDLMAELARMVWLRIRERHRRERARRDFEDRQRAALQLPAKAPTLNMNTLLDSITKPIQDVQKVHAATRPQPQE